MSSSTQHSSHHVTAVISQQVRRGRERGYEAWMREIVSAAREFEGYLGISVLKPQPGTASNYVIVLQFDTSDHLQAWFTSDIRRHWLNQVRPLIKDNSEHIQVLTGLESWFQLPSQLGPAAPKRYKQAVLVWVGVMLVSFLVTPWVRLAIAPLPAFIQTPINGAVTVTLLVYVIMPRLTHWFRDWLFA